MKSLCRSKLIQGGIAQERRVITPQPKAITGLLFYLNEVQGGLLSARSFVTTLHFFPPATSVNQFNTLNSYNSTVLSNYTSNDHCAGNKFLFWFPSGAVLAFSIP